LKHAAKAAAIFERTVMDELRQEQIDEGNDSVSAGELPKVFSPAEFSRDFKQLLMIRVMDRLIKLLKLDDFRDDLLRKQIDKVFHVETKDVYINPAGQREGQKVFYGDAEAQMMNNLRKKHG
jgi:hypothetical protein